MGVEIGVLYVRRAAFIRATPARVWQEFSTFDRLAAWFGTGHQLEAYQPEPGGRVLLSVQIEGERKAFGGSVLVFEPERELSFENNWESDGWPVPTLVTLRLRALYEGCQVELFHHGFERLGANADAVFLGYESGWDVHHLQALKEIIEG